MPQTLNETHSRVAIDAQLAALGWHIHDANSVRYEVVLDDGTRADYVLCDRAGRAMAVIEAKRFAVNPADAAAQGKHYAQRLGVPYVFLANGAETRFWEWGNRSLSAPGQNLLQAGRPGAPLRHPAAAAQSARRAHRQANINSKELKAFRLPLPPTDLQRQFETHCRSITAMDEQQSAATVKAQETFDALLGQVFSQT